jgi:hypothetical protein
VLSEILVKMLERGCHRGERELDCSGRWTAGTPQRLGTDGGQGGVSESREICTEGGRGRVGVRREWEEERPTNRWMEEKKTSWGSISLSQGL